MGFVIHGDGAGRYKRGGGLGFSKDERFGLQNNCDSIHTRVRGVPAFGQASIKIAIILVVAITNDDDVGAVS